MPFTTSESITSIVEALNKLAPGNENETEWRFGYIGNCSGIEGTPAFKDDRAWTVWMPRPDFRPGKSHENLGYVTTDELEILSDRASGVWHYVRATK